MSSAESKMRDAICALGAKLAARGLCPCTSGNISARVADGWLMTPTNSSLGELDPAQVQPLQPNPALKDCLTGAAVVPTCASAPAHICFVPNARLNDPTTGPAACGVSVIGVIKADAYGLGAAAVAEAIAELVDSFYVHDVAEAVGIELKRRTGRSSHAAGKAKHRSE